jgi:hypothetical protein
MKYYHPPCDAIGCYKEILNELYEKRLFKLNYLLNYLLTYLLTTESRVLLEKLTGL